MDAQDLPAALGAPDNAAVQLGLARIATSSGKQPAELVPALYDPANTEVLNLIRQGTDADTISRAWDRLNPSSQPAAPAPEPEPAPAVPAPVAQTYAAPEQAKEQEHPAVTVQADELILGKALSILEQAMADIKALAKGVNP